MADRGDKYWLVAVPCDGTGARGVKKTMRRLTECIHVKGRRLAEISYFPIPSLKVGTLDALMVLSDELGRVDSYIESVLRKIERQYAESEAAITERKADQGEHKAGLSVQNKSPSEYVASFKWDHDHYESADQLPAHLVARFQNLVEKADRDVKSYMAAYADKKSMLASLHRKTGGNLLVSSLDTIITPEVIHKGLYVNSDFMVTEAVVVPLVSEAEFLKTYEFLDPESVPCGPEGDRESVRGSPVVPGSALRVKQDDDGYVLYTVVVLRKFVDSFRDAARARRYTVREFEYNPATAGTAAEVLAKAQVEATNTLSQVKLLCHRKYGEVFAIWMHVKAIRVFVESVLRFGLPVNFVCAVIKPKSGSEEKLHASLAAEFSDSDDGFGMGGFGGNNSDDMAMMMAMGKGAGGAGLDSMALGPDAGGAGDDFHPYVFLEFVTSIQG